MKLKSICTSRTSSSGTEGEYRMGNILTNYNLIELLEGNDGGCPYDYVFLLFVDE